MLIEFKFRNFFSYKDEAQLLMTPIISFKEHLETHIISNENNIDLLKTAAIYGSNGGGKSNFISAMGFMKKVIHNSFADSLKEDKDKEFRDNYFKLSVDTEKAPSFFETSFIQNNAIYRYGFEISGYEIIKEWLYKKVESETMLYERNKSDFKINKSGFAEGIKYKEEVNTNVLFLSHLAQYNAKESSIVINWFRNLNVISALVDRNYRNVTVELLKQIPEFKTWLALAVRFLEINNIEAGENKDIISFHNKYDTKGVIIDSVSFDFEKEESQGTKKLVYLLGAIYDTLMNGKVLFIDELDSKLHPNLSKKLLEFFHKLNTKNAQFIFTAHDATLLDKELFRRDQIWFVDRNKFGASEIYGMSEFDAKVVRNTSDFRKKYLDSVFGAAETLKITDELINLMK